MPAVRLANPQSITISDWGECYCSDNPKLQAAGLPGCCGKARGAACVYGANHSVVVYKTDLKTWSYEGVALPLSARISGTEFRPCVIYNNQTKKYLMWYEDRHPGQQGYGIAASDTPVGPYATVVNATGQTGGKIGDFDLLVDDDGKAYQVRTGNIIEQLTDDYLNGSGKFVSALFFMSLDRFLGDKSVLSPT